MSSYNMPPDTSAKEKIVGGILDFTQLLFLLGGVAIGLGIGFLFKPAFGTVGLAFFIIIFALAGLAIGFIKIICIIYNISRTPEVFGHFN